MAHPSKSIHPRIGRPGVRRAAAFTLIEMLTVVGVMVLVLALAVPLFNTLTGARSLDGAQNQINALLGAARATAMGDQRIAGVMFFLDTGTQRINVVMVEASGDAPAGVEVMLDLLPDQTPLTLSAGVECQTIDNAVLNTNTPPERQDDGYVGYNAVTSGGQTSIPVGGTILFDGRGQVLTIPFGLRLRVPGALPNTWDPTDMGRLLFPQTTLPDSGLIVQPPAAAAPVAMSSQVGMVLFDGQRFHNNASYTEADPQFVQGVTYSGSNEEAEEKWIDDNSIPLIVNRYNGTLIKGE